MTTSDSERLTDPVAIVAALADHGIQIPQLQTQHAGQDGTVFRFDVDASEAIATWERIRPLTKEIGYYPVVCQDSHGTLAELPELNETRPAETLRAAEAIRGAAWFAARAASDEEYYGEVEEGAWEEVEPQTGWTIPFDILTGEPADGVWIALVPTTTPWAVLAYLHYGGWNECPAAAEHVAVHRVWYERFGAEVVCVSGDVVEMRVARPPTDREAALALAREQFVYSGGDLVYQGYGSLLRLASGLIDARSWFFWWD